MTLLKVLRPLFFFSAALVLSKNVSAAESSSAGRPSKSGVQITREPGKLRVEIGGKLFTEYHYDNVSRPFFYPVIGPTGAAMTRNWPMKTDVESEPRDHPHQKSLWWAHGEVNGVDFWSEEKGAGKTVHEKFIEVKSGPQVGVIRSENKLVTKEGKVLCTDETTMRIYDRPNERLLDYEITVHADHGDVVFGDTKEGTMGIRLAATMQLKGKVGQGHIINSEGVRDDQTWGKRAKWCDYFGPVDGKTVGVAMFDHPTNPRHPTWWHVRDYGLFAANPFGLHYFENKAKGAGDFTIPAGKSATFRYRMYFHSGNEKQAEVEAHYQEYVAETSKK